MTSVYLGGGMHVSVKGECVYCGTPAGGYDHPIPRGRGGLDEDRVPCCQRCNSSKSDRTPEEWLALGLYGNLVVY